MTDDFEVAEDDPDVAIHTDASMSESRYSHTDYNLNILQNLPYRTYMVGWRSQTGFACSFCICAFIRMVEVSCAPSSFFLPLHASQLHSGIGSIVTFLSWCCSYTVVLHH